MIFICVSIDIFKCLVCHLDEDLSACPACDVAVVGSSRGCSSMQKISLVLLVKSKVKSRGEKSSNAAEVGSSLEAH